MIAIFEQVLILIIFCLAGYIFSKIGVLKPEHSKTLSGLLVYIILPCVSFDSFSAQFTLTYLMQSWPLMAVCTGLLLIMVIIAKVIARLVSKDPYEKNVNEYSIAIPNIGYMGYPLAQGLYGAAGLLDAQMFCLPMNIYINTVGYNMLTAGTTPKPLWKKIFTPGMIGLLIGAIVGFFQIPVPKVIAEASQRSSACMGPISMLLTGIAISQFPIKELLMNKKVYLISAIRIIAVPVLVGLLLKGLQLNFALKTAMVICAMPCGMNTIVFPKLVGKDCRLGAGTVMVSTAVSLATIPLLLYIFT